MQTTLKKDYVGVANNHHYKEEQMGVTHNPLSKGVLAFCTEGPEGDKASQLAEQKSNSS